MKTHQLIQFGGKVANDEVTCRNPFIVRTQNHATH